MPLLAQLDQPINNHGSKFLRNGKTAVVINTKALKQMKLVNLSIWTTGGKFLMMKNLKN